MFTISWIEFKCGIFFPFGILTRVLQKIMTKSVEPVARIWSAQSWFPQLLQLMVENSYMLRNNPDV